MAPLIGIDSASRPAPDPAALCPEHDGRSLAATIFAMLAEHGVSQAEAMEEADRCLDLLRDGIRREGGEACDECVRNERTLAMEGRH